MNIVINNIGLIFSENGCYLKNYFHNILAYSDSTAILLNTF